LKHQPKILSVEDLVATTLSVNKEFDGQVWWRGQRDTSWKLTPSIVRHPPNARSEQNLVARFMHKAPSRHASVPNVDDYAAWLFLMQHYRLPTRLLDWTESPLIAAFFASETDPSADAHPSAVHDSDGSLFALSPYRLNLDQAGRRELLLPNHDPADKIIRAAFVKKGKDSDKILAIRPSEVDQRLMVQLSVFTLHGSRRLLEDIPGFEIFIHKFIIPSHAKTAIRHGLKLLGVREMALFPDLEHLAKDIASTRFQGDSDPGDFPVLGTDTEEHWGESSSG